MHADDIIVAVVTQIAAHVSPENIMLVGAMSRDILHASYSNMPPARTTHDVDIALALDSWDTFNDLKKAFPKTGVGWQNISIGNIPVDVLPFGDIEAPPGTVMSPDGFALNTAGLRQVFENSMHHLLSNGKSIRIPTPAGLAALKLHAWLDRHPIGVYKDASDIALIMTWYEGESDMLYALNSVSYTHLTLPTNREV